jgi:hypothetical protein
VFFSKEQIEQSVKRLNDLNPFFGTTFLAFKKEQLPIGKTKSINSTSILNTFLRQYYQPIEDYSGFYTPFKTWNNKQKRWNSYSSYANSLHVTADKHFSDVLIHPAGSGWGWQPNYIAVIASKYLKKDLIPAFDLAVWLFHSRQWQNDIESADVIEALLTEFFVEENEKKLFDVSSPLLATPWLQEHPISKDALLNITSSPPGRITEGALLQTIKLTGVGPAEKFELDLASRLNVITGDNGLGKTFLLECAWRALTGNWIGYPARPRQDAKTSSIAFQIGKPSRNEKVQVITYSWDRRTWGIASERASSKRAPSERNTLPGLSIFAQVDGSFAVWDPAKHLLAREENYAGHITDALTRLSRSSILHGLSETDQYGRIQKATGLINDWVRWQEAADQTHFEALSAALYALSPHLDQEALIPGLPTRMPELNDSRDIPTLKFPYGDVPIIYCSAGIQRIVSLAYLLVWAWQEHVKTATSIRRKPAQSMVLLIDEMEAHLHPLWQRTILPALMSAVQEIVSEVQVQVIVATHSPLVLASAEPLFDHDQDKLFHLYLEDGSVLLDEVPFVKRGRADLWLTSDVFGLAQPRSLEAEKAIEAANQLQLEKDPLRARVQEVSDTLVKVLAPDDEFWPVWIYFAKQRGVSLDARTKAT